MTGMRSSSGGTRASREGEPDTQEAHVTDAARVRLSCRTRDTRAPHTSLRSWLRGRGMQRAPRTCWVPAPRPASIAGESGSDNGLTSRVASSNPGTPGQGVERAPTAAQHLRHEPRRNLWLVPERVGRRLTNASGGAERLSSPVESRPPRVTGNAVARQRASALTRFPTCRRGWHEAGSWCPDAQRL
jgi:hypothetical protein